MEKNELRKVHLSILKAQDRHKKSVYDRRLVERFFSSALYKEANTLALYMAFDFEFNTDLIIKEAQADGKRVVIPKTYPKGKMIFIRYEADKLIKTSFGILEPISDKGVAKSEIDVIVVPGVAFNEQGFRIGYGGGYYDRYLADYQGQTVSLIYPSQLCHFQPDDLDIPMKGLLYEKNTNIL